MVTQRTFAELPHRLHVGREILGDQGHQRMVMLQLVDQVVAVKNVGASLRLTVSPRARGRGRGKGENDTRGKETEKKSW